MRKPLVASLAILAAFLPASAHAGPLLSGYGGPGQGSQAILGAALLNGPGGGGGSTPSARTGSAAPSESGAAKLVPQTPGGRASGNGRGRVGRAGATPRTGAQPSASGEAGSVSARVAATQPPGPVLGLSEQDLLYGLLALAILLLTGALTVLLARAPKPQSGGDRRPVD